MIDYEKLKQEQLDYLDSLSDEELLQKLKECGLKVDEKKEEKEE